MRNIEVLLADGLIGNKAVLLGLSALTTGNLNSKIKSTSKPFTMQDVLPSTHDYIVPPKTDTEAQSEVNSRLFAFIMGHPGSEAVA